MKKIIALAIIAVSMVSASFALDLEIGAKVFGGQNVADGSSAASTVKSLNANSQFQYGGAAYLNFALFGGLGIQLEPTIIKGLVSFETTENGGTQKVTSDYDALSLDVPLMVWLNLDLWKLTIGFGGGVDFSMDLNRNESYLSQLSAEARKQASAASEGLGKMSFAWIVGLDGKFYLTDHLGIVGSARYIMDVKKKDVPIKVNDYNTGASYPTIEYGRRFLYGALGLEFKFF